MTLREADGIPISMTLRQAGEGIQGRFWGLKILSQKIQKNFERRVDTRKAPRLYTPHNEGGAPLATKEFALVKSKRAA